MIFIKRKKILYTVFILYMIIILKLTVFRSSFSFEDLFKNGTISLIPFYTYYKMYYNDGLPWTSYLFLGNISGFIPFGFFIKKLTKTSSHMTVIYGFCFSFLIEFSQYMFGVGESELDDLLLNTLGVFFGVLICNGIKKIADDNKKNSDR